MSRLPFFTLDVFTDKALTGNPLAIIHDADGLDGSAMQAIAREMNLSETVFVLKPTNPAHNARIRIFTPTKELPFAGHPTVGTAVHLAEAKFGRAEEREAIVVLEEEIGTVRCAVKIMPNQATYGEFDAPKLAVETGKPAAREKIATALGLMPADIGFDNHKPTMFDAGTPFVFIPVKDRATLQQARPVLPAWRDAFGADGKAYLYTRLPPETKHSFRARMFAPGLGISEDPATGSAAAAFSGVVARFESLSDGRHILPIEQGIEMGRPSLITLEVEFRAGRLTTVRIGGGAVAVCEGSIAV